MRKIISMVLCALTLACVALSAVSCSSKRTVTVKNETQINPGVDIYTGDEKLDRPVTALPSDMKFVRTMSTVTTSSEEETPTTPITSVTITATVLPEYATDKSCSWFLSWDGTYDENVTDYVKLSVDESDSRICTVSLYKFFGKRTINLTVKTKDGGASSVCPLQCFEAVKISGVQHPMGGNWDNFYIPNQSEYSENIGKCYLIDLIPHTGFNRLNFNYDSRLKYEYDLLQIRRTDWTADVLLDDAEDHVFLSVSDNGDYCSIKNFGTSPISKLKSTYTTIGGAHAATLWEVLTNYGQAVFRVTITDKTFGTSDTIYFTYKIPSESVSTSAGDVGSGVNLAFSKNSFIQHIG